jgi:hypothetical protein
MTLCLILTVPVLATRPLHAQVDPFPHVILDNDMTGWNTIFLNSKVPAGNPESVDKVIAAAFRRYIELGNLPGIDAQSLSVLYSTFPGWGKSHLYTLADHDRFLRGLRYYQDSGKHTSGYPGNVQSNYRLYLQNGQDLVADFMSYNDKSRPKLDKILSFRLNDYHYNWNWALYNSETKSQIIHAKPGTKPFCDRSGHSESDVDSVEQWTQTSFTQYFQAFQTGQLDPQLSGRCVDGICLTQEEVQESCGKSSHCILSIDDPKHECAVVTLNLAVPVVERFKLMQMAEVVSNYHPHYFEIDLDRYPHDFESDVSTTERIATMTNFLNQISTTLRKIDPSLRIGLRVPSKLLHREALGIDLPILDHSGLIDYVILAMPTMADQQIQYQIDPSTSHMRVYAEIFQNVENVPSTAASFDGFAALAKAGFSLKNRLYPIDSWGMLTAAHLAYAHHHVYGMALFNSQYYLYNFLDENSSRPLSQPSAAMSRLGDSKAVAESSQHYFLTSTHYHLQRVCDPARQDETVCDQLPFDISRSQNEHEFSLDMAPPTQGWDPKGGLLRMTYIVTSSPDQRPATSEDYQKIHDELTVSINGNTLSHDKRNLSWPLNPADGPVNNAYYKTFWWTAPVFNLILPVDPRILKDGMNAVSIKCFPKPGDKVQHFRIVNFEMFLPAKSLKSDHS